MNIASKLLKLRVAIVTHEYATGPSHALEKYLQGKTADLTFIAHPFVFAIEKRSHMRCSSGTDVQGKEIFFPWYIPFEPLNIIKDVLLTLWWCIRVAPIDVYIGVDNINACVGILLQKTGLVKKTVFYTIDYIPRRFANPFLNAVYHMLDSFVVKNANTLWNLSSIMVEERAKKGLGDKTLRSKQIVVPVGTDETIAPLPFGDVKRYHLAHMGHLTRKQGVQLVIEAIPIIKKRLPRFHLYIIGGGPMEEELKELAKTHGVASDITFYGFIKDHEEVEGLLATCAAAVAPYVDSHDNFVRYTDPGKVKAYLAVGLPIVITKVPDVWRQIVRMGAGIAVSDTSQALADAIVELLSNDKRLRDYRAKAAAMGRQFLWTKVFEKAFRQTLD